MAAVFKPEEPSPPLTPEREAARQVLNDEEREDIGSDGARPRPSVDRGRRTSGSGAWRTHRAATQAKGVSDGLSNVGRIGDMALDVVLILACSD